MMRKIIYGLVAIIMVLGIVLPMTLPKDLLADNGKASPNNPIERIDLRTENSKTYDIGNDTFKYVGSLSLVHYKDNYNSITEQWKDIDLTIVDGKITKAPYELTIDYNNKSATMKDKKTGSTATVSLVDIKDKDIKNKTLNELYKSRAVWKDIATDTDFEIVATNSSVQFKRILKSDKAPIEATFDIVQSGTGISVISQARYSDTGEAIPVTTSKSGGLLTETIDKSKITKYPIEIDPTLTIQPSGKDGRMYESVPTTNFGAETSFYVGQGTGLILRSPVEFPITWGTDIPAGVTITSSTLSLYAHTIYLATGRTYWAYRLLRLDWNEAQFTWNIYKTGSNWTTAGAGSNGNDYTSTNGASTTVPASAAWMNWNVLAQVQTAQTGSLQIAFLIKDGTENSTAYTTFYSREYAVDTSRCPKLVIIYQALGTVHTDAADDILSDEAILNGEITAIGGDTPTYYGWCWGLTSNATTPASWQSPSSLPPAYTGNYTSGVGSYGVGNYDHDITGLTEGSTYYFRFAAYNTSGWAWGNELEFDTIGDPVIDTEPETDVTASSATLHALLSDDGGQTIGCDVRWGYGNVTQLAANFASYVTVTAWTGNYTSGQYPNLAIDSLTSNMTYYYRIQARNDAGVVTSATEESFLTDTSVGTPSNLKGSPTMTTMVLTWTKGTGASNTVVVQKVGLAPTTTADGTIIYSGTDSTYTDTPLLSGITYGYSAWGWDGAAAYSAGYTSEIMTTTSGSTTTDIISTPTAPSGYTDAPVITGLDKLPTKTFVDQFDLITGFPAVGFYFLLFVGFGLIAGYVAYRITHSIFNAMIVMTVAMFFGWVVHVVALVYVGACIVLTLFLWYLKTRQTG